MSLTSARCCLTVSPDPKVQSGEGGTILARRDVAVVVVVRCRAVRRGASVPGIIQRRQ